MNEYLSFETAYNIIKPFCGKPFSKQICQLDSGFDIGSHYENIIYFFFYKELVYLYVLSPLLLTWIVRNTNSWFIITK